MPLFELGIQCLSITSQFSSRHGAIWSSSDTASGKLAERPELTLCMGYLRAGDTLVVWRLGRLLRHLVETVNALPERGVAFASLHEGIDTTTSKGV